MRGTGRENTIQRGANNDAGGGKGRKGSHTSLVRATRMDS